MKTKDGTFHLYIFFPAMGEIKIALDSVRNPPPPLHLNFCSDRLHGTKEREKNGRYLCRGGTTHSEKHNRERQTITIIERTNDTKKDITITQGT
jgi:hypothetical protein